MIFARIAVGLCLLTAGVDPLSAEQPTASELNNVRKDPDWTEKWQKLQKEAAAAAQRALDAKVGKTAFDAAAAEAQEKANLCAKDKRNC